MLVDLWAPSSMDRANSEDQALEGCYNRRDASSDDIVRPTLVGGPPLALFITYSSADKFVLGGNELFSRPTG